VKKILIYLKTGDKFVTVSDRLHDVLCVYKMFWPPETTIKIGSKVLVVKGFTPWPPPEQIALLEVEARPQSKKSRDLG